MDAYGHALQPPLLRRLAHVPAGERDTHAEVRQRLEEKGVNAHARVQMGQIQCLAGRRSMQLFVENALLNRLQRESGDAISDP